MDPLDTPSGRAAEYEALNHLIERRHVSPLAHRINLVMMPMSLALLLVVIADIDTPLRIWLTILVFALAPASGIVQFFRLPDPALQLGLVLAISMSFDMLLGQALLWADNLNAPIAIGILTALTFVRPISRQLRFAPERFKRAAA